MLRVLRVLRIIKLVPKASGLRTMMMTLLWSLPALFNVAMVLFLFMFIYVSRPLCCIRLLIQSQGARLDSMC